MANPEFQKDDLSTVSSRNWLLFDHDGAIDKLSSVQQMAWHWTIITWTNDDYSHWRIEGILSKGPYPPAMLTHGR